MHVFESELSMEGSPGAHRFCFTVVHASNHPDEKGAVTLVWSDHPAHPTAGKQLVNDLDLLMACEHDGHKLRWGNGGQKADSVNPVEQVVIPDFPSSWPIGQQSLCQAWVLGR